MEISNVTTLGPKYRLHSYLGPLGSGLSRRVAIYNHNGAQYCFSVVWDNGKEYGNYYSILSVPLKGLYRGYIGIMEKNM